ncbi:MAG: FtsX-like permease family protein [Cyclobacteriaceae bacterium]
MLKNFLKLTIRNLIKNKTYVAINIIGLGLSLACCIVAFLNYDFAMSFDKNHENLDVLYKVHSNKLIEGNKYTYGITPLALGASLEGESTAVSKQSRYAGTDLTILNGDRALQKFFGCVESDYLDMFSYPLKYGEKTSINRKGNIIISAELSEILYGKDTNPVGQLLKADNEGQQLSFIVGGVLEKIPENTSMQFEGLINLEHYFDLAKTNNNNWRGLIAGTFVMIDDAGRTEEVENILQTYVPVQNQARNDWKIAEFYLEPMKNVAFVGRDIRSHWMYSAPHPMMILVPPIMAILMLLIACFNFTNTSIAISSKRLKEIGVRKVMGSNRQQLILQFMGENLMLCFFALIVGVAISLWLVPAFSAMWPGIDLQFDAAKNVGLILFIVGLLIFTALVAGIYPSLYISKFDSVSILKGTMSVGKTSWLSYSLLTFQYLFTIVALIASVAFIKNAIFQRNTDLGFNTETVLYVNLDSPEEGKALRNSIVQQAAVSSAILSRQHVSSWSYSRTVKDQDKEMLVDVMDLGLGYMESMGMKVIDGRGFDKQNEETDRKNNVIVNETMARSFGWQNPVGQRLTIGDSVRVTVVGVAKDYYNNGFWGEIDPIMIRLSEERQANFLIVSTTADQAKTVMGLLETAWIKVAPNKLFRGEYQDVVLKESLMVNNNIVVIFSFLGILAVILSAIGLFTLVSLNVLRRVKEIGVRKVLGAETTQILALINKVFVIVLIIATIFGATAAVYSINILMSEIFSYYKEVDLFTVLLPVGIVTTISLGISSFRILKTAQKNPVESLRYE